MKQSNAKQLFFSARQPERIGREYPGLIRIGERLNTLGSKKFKQLILEERYAEIVAIAEQQVQDGAHGLDVCVALTERSDEAETMQKVIHMIAPAVDVPLMIDSTRLEVMETALQTATAKSILNSTNLENGPEKADQVFGLANQYDASVVALTIDEQGMAKTAARKLEVARRLYDIAVNRHGFDPGRLIIDALTFTLSIGDPDYAASAQETLQAIGMIKQEFPDVLTSLGVSNVSFGFPPEIRLFLNNVMLHHAFSSGLDMAIINPAHVKPYAEIAQEEQKLAEDLIFNQPDALRSIVTYYRKQRAQKKA